jgi:hypothetical protein
MFVSGWQLETLWVLSKPSSGMTDLMGMLWPKNVGSGTCWCVAGSWRHSGFFPSPVQA